MICLLKFLNWNCACHSIVMWDWHFNNSAIYKASYAWNYNIWSKGVFWNNFPEALIIPKNKRLRQAMIPRRYLYCTVLWFIIMWGRFFRPRSTALQGSFQDLWSFQGDLRIPKTEKVRAFQSWPCPLPKNNPAQPL